MFKYGWILSFFICLVLLNLNAQPVDVPQAEYDALVAFYDSTNGGDWTRSDFWLNDNMVGKWYGVLVLGGHVTNISLSNNNLNGNLPPNLADLTALNELTLSENHLYDTIPNTLGNLTNLKYLSLDKNQLEGSLPQELGNLVNLLILNLSFNNFTGSISDTLMNLSSLVTLHLAYNQFTGSIPDSIGKLDSVSYLDLSHNQLTGPIPPSIGELTQLSGLHLANNQLTGMIPPELGNLKNLSGLYLAANQLTGSIPAELDSMTNLFELSLSSNQLSGSIPPELGNLTKLIFCYLSNNQLSGSIPPELAKLTKLVYCKLSNNQLTGTIPPSFGKLISLSGLDLAGNNLSGSIPDSLSYLKKLDYLFLNDNLFDGSIPAALGNMSSLQNLNLSSNKLSGSLPPELGNLSNLKFLNVAFNELSGEIPGTLSNSSNLEKLYLNHNRFSGKVPEGLANGYKLNYIAINNNKLQDLPVLKMFIKESASNFLYVFSNQFTFEDIEPNLASADYFGYIPQDSVGERKDTTIYEGGEITISVEVGGSANRYQWLKDGMEIKGANSAGYTINPAKRPDAGSYVCRITNDIVTLLTLYSRPVSISIPGAPYFVSAHMTTAHMDSLFSYTARAKDPDGGIVAYTFFDYPAWLTPGDSVISGVVPSDAADTSFAVIASNGILKDTLKVTIKMRDLSSVAIIENPIPTKFYLKQNYPNPFNPSTSIRYGLPEATMVMIRIYTLQGKLIKEFNSGRQQAGSYELTWDASAMPSGTYFIRLSSKKFTRTIKCMVVK